MQIINFLTYSDKKYYSLQASLVTDVANRKIFTNIITKTREDLIKTDFYKYNKSILDEPRGAGYWLWKPYFILETLTKMPENSILMYLDCGDSLENTETMRTFLSNKMYSHDILLTDGSYKNSDWTKRDCFVYMNCDEEKFYNTIQVEAGIIVVKNTIKARSILKSWLTYCQVAAISTDTPNTSGKNNLDGFKDHRHDQSVLTNLKVLHNIYSSNEMRKYVHCNKYSI